MSSWIGESSKVHLVADLSERALTKGSFQLFFFSILRCHKDDLCLIHSSPSLTVDFKGKGASDRIDGARKIYTSTHQEPTWVCYDSVAFFIRYCSNIEQKQCELLLGKCTNLFREVAPVLVNIYAFISTLTQPNSFSCWWRGEVQLLPHCTETPLASPVASDSQTDLYLCLFFVFSLPSPLHPGWSLQAALFSPSRSLFGSWWDVRDVVVVMNLWPDGEKCDDSARKKEGQIVRGKCR